MNKSELFTLANKIRKETGCSQSEAYHKAKAQLENPVEDSKKFSLIKALNGGKVKTKSGKNAKVICKTNDGKLLVMVYSNCASYMDRQVKYCMNGSRWSPNHDDQEDLIMA